ncbi:McrB family protein [Rhodococcus erythropolis]|jgi:5-methylcytosine-specific restriction protein B|uniref:McrB family protein n=1 Tax=Rhodococcus erythropolis TaxID=1833 RepID=UPI0008D53744|nr:AAA family ATPase [Rhodococcus erythropolis]OFV75127.1 5-methylcytosine-specific restriction enzyme B [Rhodococcus erythropolis]
MGRFKEDVSRQVIDETVELWRTKCLIADGSVTQSEETAIWTSGIAADLATRFTENPIVGSDGGGTFASKFEVQLKGASPELRLFAAELLLVHFLFTSSVSRRGKVDVIEKTLADSGYTLDVDSVPYLAMSSVIGHPGIGFNTRRDLQLGFLIDFVIRLKKLSVEDRTELLSDPWALEDFVREAPSQNQREMMHILLHLLHPDSFERIASGTHKREIADAFSQLLDGEVPDDWSTDRKLLAIRTALEDDFLVGGNIDGSIDFYHPPLQGVWQSRTGGEGEGTSDIESLEWKKQLILYGPPGTSKTFTARELSKTLILREALRSWGPRKFFDNKDLLDRLVIDHVEWVQLHPGYGYAEFIRGLRLEKEETRYQPGLLPNLIERIASQELPDGLTPLPFVLVLDEINRTDLSAMLGEAFSLLERDKRDFSVTLPGINNGEGPTTLAMPSNLYIIGTMNEIDQSVETLDFALRRRFLWRECPFERDTLLEIVRHRWEEDMPARYSIEHAMGQLEIFADRAQEINDAIFHMDELGRAYQIGHTYFADITFFLERWLSTGRSRPQSGTYLWSPAGHVRAPLRDLWDRSLKPLLEQYLSGTDDRESSLSALESTFLKR